MAKKILTKKTLTKKILMIKKPEEVEDDSEFELPSKSQIKRDCDALLKLGEDLIKLKVTELDEIHLPEELDDAIREAQRLKSRSGLKRQRQYIGKIMRTVDAEEVTKQFNKIKHKHDTNTASFKKTEHWRDKLLSEGHDAITEVIDVYPNIDRQHINQLVRQAHQDLKHEKPPAAARKLFKYLRELEETND